MNRHEFDRALDLIRDVAAGKPVPYTAETAQDIMMAALHVPQKNYMLDASSEEIPSDLAAKGMMVQIATLIEDALRGPLAPDVMANANDMAKSVSTLVISMGLKAATKNWLEYCDLNSVEFTDTPDCNTVKNSVVQILGHTEKLFKALGATSGILFSAEARYSYDSVLNTYASTLLGAKAIYRLMGYDFSKIDVLLDDAYSIKYTVPGSRVKDTSDIVSRGKEYTQEIAAILSERRTLN